MQAAFMGEQTMSLPRVCVLIPAYNAGRTLRGCLEALCRQQRLPDQVVVVDNASTDGTGDVARSFVDRLPGLVILQEPRPGEPIARNRGLQAVDADVVAFTDADCVPREDWLVSVLECFRSSPSCHAVAGKVVGHRPRSLAEKYLSVVGFPTPEEPETVEGTRFPPRTFYTANLAVRREVLQALGGFDERLNVGCDVDLCVRLLRAGYRIRYQPEVVVAHAHRDSLGKAGRRIWQYGTGVPLWFRKHAEPGLWITLPGGRAMRLRVPLRGWINLSTPDRCILAFGVLAVWQPWTAALLVNYLARLSWRVRDLARRRGVPLSPWELLAVTALHVVEFAVFTAGSISGSLRQRVLCVV